MKKLILLITLFSTIVFANSITIFAASDLQYALKDIKQEFLKKYPNNKITIIYGSSGKGMRQVAQNAPYDIYFSANMDYVETLYKKGFIVTKPILYAIGRIVIWSKNKNFDPKIGFNNFTKSWVNKIAIANPSHAPYGQKAKQSMVKKDIYNKIKPKIIFGENISATTSYIDTKAADIGVIALSLVLNPHIADTKYNKYYLIPSNLHEPLEQGYGITSYGKNSKLALKFYNFMQQNSTKVMMKKFGFSI